uniref:Uncharacterized protein n=1 Tax=Tetradesmus obliquus TaxID=3088 RepID=A0A383VEZ7_TETOB|eukprot:jgi/Sobl393_1/8590/SZX63312.1
MRTRSNSYSSVNANNHNGADVVAACGPLQLIAASLLASCKDSKQAGQQLYNLLSTSKVFSQALQGCQGLLPATFGPPATAEATAAFAEWLTKYGHLAGSLELQLLPKDGKRSQQDCAPGVSQRTFTELAIAAALGKAAAAGSNSGSSHGLCIRSCKLSDAGLDSAAILQALPGSTLTSLDLD